MSEDFELVQKKLEGTAPANFNINKVLKRNFKIECLRNDQTMSEVLETLMESYVIKSREMHLKAEAKKNKKNASTEEKAKAE